MVKHITTSITVGTWVDDEEEAWCEIYDGATGDTLLVSPNEVEYLLPHLETFLKENQVAGRESQVRNINPINTNYGLRIIDRIWWSNWAPERLKGWAFRKIYFPEGDD